MQPGHTHDHDGGRDDPHTHGGHDHAPAGGPVAGAQHRPDDPRDHGYAHHHADDGHDHAHDHGRGLRGWVRAILVPHSHYPAMAVDSELEASARGMRALWVSLVGLGLTALVQALVFVFTGSAALLSDTLHNVATR